MPFSTQSSLLLSLQNRYHHQCHRYQKTFLSILRRTFSSCPHVSANNAALQWHLAVSMRQNIAHKSVLISSFHLTTAQHEIRSVTKMAGRVGRWWIIGYPKWLHITPQSRWSAYRQHCSDTITTRWEYLTSFLTRVTYFSKPAGDDKEG